MTSKQRWYQCWERCAYPKKRAIQIYRQYHRMHAVPTQDIEVMRPEWTAGYVQSGFSLDKILSAPPYWWDGEVLRLLADFGAGYFAKIDIWDIDWAERARRIGFDPAVVYDPRDPFERAVHQWLRRTQGRAGALDVRIRQVILRIWGW
jgi:hypothetical protein